LARLKNINNKTMNKIFNSQTYRPYISVEEKNSLLGKKIKHKDGVFYKLIISITNLGVCTSHSFIDYKELLESCTFEDESPCGIKVEKENNEFNLSLLDLFNYPEGTEFYYQDKYAIVTVKKGILYEITIGGSCYVTKNLLESKFKQVER